MNLHVQFPLYEVKGPRPIPLANSILVLHTVWLLSDAWSSDSISPSERVRANVSLNSLHTGVWCAWLAYHRRVRSDHNCLVEAAETLGLLDGSPIQPSWCLSYWREALMASDPIASTDSRLMLCRAGPLSVHYAPWDWINSSARIMIVGITPGAYQATQALQAAQSCLRRGSSNEEALCRAATTGSFSGPMRRNLVAMLDGIGLADAVGVDTTARLFDADHRLAAFCSAIDYPVFAMGRNYSGASPPLERHPLLRSLVRACLGTRVRMTPDALVIPLGSSARQAVSMLISQGLMGSERCLLGVPHPSGRNGHRTRHYADSQADLIETVDRWACSQSPPS
jgi:hypothetical protein